MDPYLGEIKLLPWGFVARGWALCNGQLMSISQNAALFALLGTTYGGNGVQTFALPNLQGRVAMHRDTQGQYPLGAIAGEEQVGLSLSQMPMHNHAFVGSTATGTGRAPTGSVLATPSVANSFYAPDSNPVQPLIPSSVNTVGGGQAHNNMQPFLVMNYCIALQGVFPSRN